MRFSHGVGRVRILPAAQVETSAAVLFRQAGMWHRGAASVSSALPRGQREAHANARSDPSGCRAGSCSDRGILRRRHSVAPKSGGDLRKRPRLRRAGAAIDRIIGCGALHLVRTASGGDPLHHGRSHAPERRGWQAAGEGATRPGEEASCYVRVPVHAHPGIFLAHGIYGRGPPGLARQDS